MLVHKSDWQSISYLVLVLVLVVWQWVNGFHLLAYAVLLFLMIGVCVIHHNHSHLGLWQSNRLNRLTDMVLTLAQGHPTYAFQATHIDNHHRFNHSEQDAARTYRFGGDTNNLWGYLAHPLYAAFALYPLFLKWLGDDANNKTRKRLAFFQYIVIAALWLGLAFLNLEKFVLFVLIPQLFGLHWLLASNYLQHAHADGQSNINFARNFGGWVNILWFNIGLHTAHHQNPQAHWSQLPRLHRAIEPQIDSRLLEKGLMRYMWRTYILSIFLSQHRSISLMQLPHPTQ
jgi:fatty acid desaturase